MKDLDIRALALDLDGTLTNSQKQVTPRTRKAIADAIGAGVAVILASGRPVLGVRPVAKELELDQKGGYILAFNGGSIVDCTTEETLYSAAMPMELIDPLCKLARERDVVFLTYSSTNVLTEYKDSPYVARVCFTNRTTVRPVKDLAAELDFIPNKMLYTDANEKLLAVQPIVREKFGDSLDCFLSADVCLEIVPKGVSKAAALQSLLQRLGLKREQLMACGDSFNDLEMLEYAGFAVAMQNAVDEVKAKADYVTLSNDEDGVAAAVEKFILHR